MTGPRPHTWLSGPDPELHHQYLAWRARQTQARFRQESWSITWSEFQQVWAGQWHLRGRGSEDLCLARIDYSGGWHLNNVNIVTRSEHARRGGGTGGYMKAHRRREKSCD